MAVDALPCPEIKLGIDVGGEQARLKAK